MAKIQYSTYFQKIEVIYKCKSVATFDYRYSISDIVQILSNLGYIMTGEDFTITKKALKFAQESTLFFNPCK